MFSQHMYGVPGYLYPRHAANDVRELVNSSQAHFTLFMEPSWVLVNGSALRAFCVDELLNNSTTESYSMKLRTPGNREDKIIRNALVRTQSLEKQQKSDDERVVPSAKFRTEPVASIGANVYSQEDINDWLAELDIFQQKLEENPQNTNYIYVLAQLNKWIGNTQESAKLFKRLNQLRANRN